MFDGSGVPAFERAPPARPCWRRPCSRACSRVRSRGRKTTADAAPAVGLGHVAVHEKRGEPLTVFVDGVDVGPAPWEGDLEEGSHAVFGKSATRTTVLQRVAVASGASLSLELTALPRALPAAAPPAVATRPVASKGVASGDAACERRPVDGGSVRRFRGAAPPRAERYAHRHLLDARGRELFDGFSHRRRPCRIRRVRGRSDRDRRHGGISGRRGRSERQGGGHVGDPDDPARRRDLRRARSPRLGLAVVRRVARRRRGGGRSRRRPHRPQRDVEGRTCRRPSSSTARSERASRRRRRSRSG